MSVPSSPDARLLSTGSPPLRWLFPRASLVMMAFAIGCTTLGAIGLALSLLVARRSDDASAPLMTFLLAAAVLVAQLVTAKLGPTAGALVTAASLPAAFLLGPFFWFYVGRLTKRPPLSRRAIAAHFFLPGIGWLVAMGFVFLSGSDRTMMLVQGSLPEGQFAATLALAAFALVVVWAPQSGVYLFQSVRSLARHRNCLEEVFASDDTTERSWLVGLTVILSVVWLVAAATLLSDNLIGVSMVGVSIPPMMSLTTQKRRNLTIEPRSQKLVLKHRVG